MWQISKQSPEVSPPASTLSVILEDAAVPKSALVSSAASPKTPPYSPRPMSLILSPGQVSVGSRMSVDPPDAPDALPHSEHDEHPPDLYDVSSGLLTTWGFMINRRLKCLICMSCHIVVLPAHVRSHVQNKHRDARISISKSFVEELARKEGLVSEYPATPPPFEVEFEGLTRAWGFCCPSCPATYSRAKDVLAHSRNDHDLELELEDLPTAWMQRFSEAPLAKSWFRVTPRSIQLHSPSANYLTALREQLNTRPALPASMLDHRHISPWHMTTRWMEYIENMDPHAIRSVIEPPQEDDPLFPLIQAVRWYMSSPYELILQSSEVCLQILNTDTMTDDFNHHPFGRHQLEGTMRSYTRLIIQLLCFLLRSQAQLQLPEDIKDLLAALTASLQEDLMDGASAVHKVLFAIWTREWTPSIYNCFPDPTLCFVIHTQVNADGSLKKPEDVTGIFAKLIYNMRLTFLYEFHLRLEEPRNPSLTSSALALRKWFTKGRESTFHTLKSLQHRASSIVMSTQNEPNMVWKDKTGFSTLIYLGHEVSLDALRRCQAALEDATASLLKDTLLFGHPFSLNIADLHDDMGNRQAGYLLFSDRVNQDVLGPVDQLADHILSTPDLYKRFVVSVREGHVIWNALALSAWLTAFARLNLLCLVQAEMNCGAPGRTTELTAMPTSNTPGGMLRALRIIGDHVVLMRTYHKMRAASGLDRVIPHSLNAALAAVFIYKEAICRPFAQLCASILFPENDEVKGLYQDYLFVNYDKPFMGDDISAEMKLWTGQHLGVELGIQKWRQCSTPLRRKHAGLEEMWLEDQDTVDSAQAGHSHRVDTLRYGVTDMSAVGMAEDYIGPFLQTSVLWHKVLHLVPGGQKLDLEQARHIHFTAEPSAAPLPGKAKAELANISQVLKEQLEPKLAAFEQRIEQAVALSQQEVRGMFQELKALLSPSQPAPPPAPASSSAASIPAKPVVPGPSSPADRTEGLYYDPPKALSEVQPSASAAGEVHLPTEEEALAALRAVLKKPAAQWANDGQKLAVMSGLEWKKDVVVILPTGSGKSAIVATLAKLETLKITAVLCPLRS
ncbi:hypothetical protein ACG7TL_002226 [Trametes sanguinea]